MKRFLIGLGLGAPVGVALILYMSVRKKMFYRVAVPTYIGGENYAFIGGVSDNIQSIKYMLSVRSNMGQDVRSMRVFGATTVDRLVQSLERYNQGKTVVVADAMRILQGFPVDENAIRNFEQTWARDQPKTGTTPCSVVEWANSLPIEVYRRLAFARWVVLKGDRFNEDTFGEPVGK